MKTLKTKSKVIDFSWLPPAEEWDFRSVTEAECRVACHWEYSRDICPLKPRVKTTRHILDANGNLPCPDVPDEGELYMPEKYHGAAKENFPIPWTAMTKEQRIQVVGSFTKISVAQILNLGQFLKQMPRSDGRMEIPQSYLENCLVVSPRLKNYGVEILIQHVTKRLRAEANKHPTSRKAAAAALPFCTLKWLAAARLDKARSKVDGTIKMARDTLVAYRKAHPRPSLYDVYPDYSSDGAWIAATAKSKKCQDMCDGNPSYLLAELA